MHSFFRWLRKPDPLLVRNEEQFKRLDSRLPLYDYDYVVCDTELTGLHKRKDEIVSIGAVRISGLQIELCNTFHTLVRPVKLDANQATFVHRITPEQLRKAPCIEEILPQFVEYCTGALVVGHCISLDLHFLNLAIRKNLGGTLPNPSLDTMNMARLYKELAAKKGVRFVGNPGSLVLDDLTTEFKLPRFKPHDALEDALQTAYLFLFLAKKLKSLGVQTLEDVRQLGRKKSEERLF